MPMTERQLSQVENDYWEQYGDHVVAVTEQYSEESCDLCGAPAARHGFFKRKMIRFAEGNGRCYRVIVCRNGIKCRKRACRKTA